MPVLRFQLQSRRIILDASLGKEEWKLVFGAVSVPVDDGQSFKILSRGKRYDAYRIAGTVYMRPNTSRPEQHPPELGVGSVSLIHPPDDLGGIQPFFEAKFFLSAESFHHLLTTDYLSPIIELWATTAMNENGLIYGNDPDGRELEWWPERSNTSVVETVSIRFIEPQA